MPHIISHLCYVRAVTRASGFSQASGDIKKSNLTARV
jgi:hypothetical protein